MAELTTVAALLKRSLRLYGDRAAFYVASDTGTKSISYREFAADVQALSSVLIQNGLKNKKVGIIGKNSFRWGVVYFAVMSCGGVVVPLDKELTVNELCDSLRRVSLDVLFYSKDVSQKVDSVKKQFKSTNFILMGGKKKSSSFTSLLKQGESLTVQGNKKYSKVKVNPDACAALLFTSGTTSQSKIVMLSQRNIISNVQRAVKPFCLTPDDKFLSILPMHHMFECNAGFLAPLYSGSSIYFSQGIRYLAQEFKEQQPTVVICVPRIIDALAIKIWKGVRAENREFVVRAVMEVTNLLGKFGYELKRNLFAQIHDQLGGRIRFLFSGAAPLSQQTMKDMKRFGFELFQGYGLTECAPAVATTHYGLNDMDSVGLPVKGTKIKILNPHNNKVGEILVKGPQVMLGYYKNTRATKNMIQHGYFRTGDLGYIKKNGCLKIVGRCKNIIITSGGKKVYPEEIESLLRTCSAIKDVVVHSLDSKHGQKVCASIVLADNNSASKRHSLELEARRHIRAINESLATFEQIQTIRFRENDFVRTSTLKVKRHLINA